MSRLDDILALPKKTHNLVQGSDAWHRFRLEHYGASEAAAMLGLSRKVKRSELLHAKHTGIAREFSEWVQANVLDNGHRVEALARPLVEAILGDELYPVTCSRGKLSASCDGLTMDDRIAFEHKQWNDDLANLVGAGVLPDEHWPQCQQILLVTGAERVIFTVSDGTPEKMVYVEVTPERALWERLVAGWDQFAADEADYTPPEPVEVVTARPMETLPAPSVRMDGALKVIDNLDVFGAALRAFVERIPEKPTEDQEFADCDAACKSLKRAEEALEAAENGALASMEDVEKMRRVVADLRNIARSARLSTEKVVARRKDEIKTEQVMRGRNALEEHVRGLNVRLGRALMPQVPADFAAAIKGLRSFDSLRNAVETTLANAKIEANRIADQIQINLQALAQHQEHAFLFADERTLVLKAPEDLQAIIAARVGEHQRKEQERLERERERIRAEEEERARAQAQREQQEREAAERRQRHEQEEAERRTQGKCDGNHGAPRCGAAPGQCWHDDAPAPAAPQDHPQYLAPAANVHPMPTRAPTAPAGPPTLKLGEIQRRIAPLSIDAAGLATLGFPHAKQEGAAKLWHEHQFQAICDALIAHLAAARDERRVA